MTVQSQADLSKKSGECLHSRALFCINLFGGYASPRKHVVFSRLALNSYAIRLRDPPATLIKYDRKVTHEKNKSCQMAADGSCNICLLERLYIF